MNVGGYRGTSTSSLPATSLFFNASIPFLYSSSLNEYIIHLSSSVVGGSTCRFGLVEIMSLPLKSN